MFGKYKEPDHDAFDLGRRLLRQRYSGRRFPAVLTGRSYASMVVPPNGRARDHAIEYLK